MVYPSFVIERLMKISVDTVVVVVVVVDKLVATD